MLESEQLPSRNSMRPLLQRLGFFIWLLAFTATVNAVSSSDLLIIQEVKDEWETTFYSLPQEQQEPILKTLSMKADTLIQKYPDAAESYLVAGLIQCSLAANEGGFSALGRVKKARQFVLQAMAKDPLAMDGSGYVILGNLYYRLPGWPISFGDNKVARSYLETAIRLYPDGLDTNYFYGDFLLDEGDAAAALPYLEKADKAAVRPSSRLSDMKLKEELKVSLKNAREGKGETQGFYNQFLNAIGK
jgi:tetratricopeptide (TPR) repeat protein